MTRFTAAPLYAVLFAAACAAPAAMAQEASAAAQGGQSWASLDTDGNGSLSKSEAAGHSALGQVYDQADTDADGQLTADEYRNFIASRSQQATPVHSADVDDTTTTDTTDSTEPEEDSPVN